MLNHKFFSATFILCCILQDASAQTYNTIGQSSGNPYMGVPFLLISPDARAGGMGDAGAASSPDANSTHWNPSKLAFVRDTLGFSVSYMPWLSQLLPDINFAYLSGFYKLNARQTLGASLRYFSLGNAQSPSGIVRKNFNPNEYALDFCYAYRLSNNWSVALSSRYIYSNLSGAATFIGTGTYSHTGQSFAADISTYYRSHEIAFFGKPANAAAGLCISNLGPKINYSNTSSYFLPANLRLGGAFTLSIDKLNKIGLLFDIDKLLVPTPPVYATDSFGAPIVLQNGQYQILAGKSPNVNVPQGIIQSFYDAPGGVKEELHEITISGGIEYLYDSQFALRVGYFYENPTKGGREFYTLGAGFRFNKLSIDAAYLIPIVIQSPLKNTLQVTLNFNFH